MTYKNDLLKWHQDYSVRVTEFDNHHKKMLHIINLLYSTIKENTKSDSLKDILQEVIDYGQYHFAAEEKTFDKFDYPEKEDHKGIHRLYTKKIMSLQKRLNKGDNDVYLLLLDFLEDWWINHINYVDKKYSDFLNGKGLK